MINQTYIVTNTPGLNVKWDINDQWKAALDASQSESKLNPNGTLTTSMPTWATARIPARHKRLYRRPRGPRRYQHPALLDRRRPEHHAAGMGTRTVTELPRD